MWSFVWPLDGFPFQQDHFPAMSNVMAALIWFEFGFRFGSGSDIMGQVCQDVCGYRFCDRHKSLQQSEKSSINLFLFLSMFKHFLGTDGQLKVLRQLP